MSRMVNCSACGKRISRKGADGGIHEKKGAYHISCAPDDLLEDAASEWNAILDRGIKYFIRKYSTYGEKPQAHTYVELFEDSGKGIVAEMKRRHKTAARR